MTYKEIKQELRLNPQNKMKCLIYLFRVSNLLINKRFLLMRIFGRIIGVFYAFLSSWLLSIDLSYRTKIGKGLIIYHGMGLVVNPEAIIGENVQLRHHTTIGNSLVDHKSPIIGNNVNIGCHVIIIGNIKIGNNCIIGAGSVITKNVPDNTIVAGNPAYIIRKNGLKCKEKL